MKEMLFRLEREQDYKEVPKNDTLGITMSQLYSVCACGSVHEQTGK